MVSPPEKVLAPESVRVPVPDFSTAPAPEITVLTVRAFERLKARVVPEDTTAEVVAIEPVVLPAPIWTVPALTSNAPVKVLAPVRMSVPEPCFIGLPPPEITPAIVAVNA